MSYRAFKHLLGETSLERKCRFLFGAGTLLLITTIFWWFAQRTEVLAYEQTTTTGRLLTNHILEEAHHKEQHNLKDRESLRQALEEFAGRFPADEETSKYRYRFIKPKAPNRENEPEGRYEHGLLEAFQSDPQKMEENRLPKPQYYYGAIRATPLCLNCHPLDDEKELYPRLDAQDLMAVVKIQIPTIAIENGVHKIWAWLLSMAIMATLLIMSGSYLIVRYIIVKPVKHLKEVSDAIAAGELNVRSEIQTGDEYEDLSHAFNRMLRNLVSMQDRWRKVNADLDRKIDELARANMALYESNRLKSDFLATMSHELRTPLNSILGFSEVLLPSNQLNDKQQRWVGNIQKSGDQLLNLINDILDLAKIEAGKMQVRLEEFSSHDIFEGLLNMFRPLAERKNIDLRGQVDPDIRLLRQDPGKLQQILSNLLSNAIKFTPEGGRVLLKAEADGPQVIFTVSDTGVGIAPEEQELVFE